MKRFTIKTIGCKVNTYESNVIKEKLVDVGFEFIDVDEKEEYKNLDYYIVNTCSVTGVADKKSRQMLHLAKKYNENVKVIAIGCMVDALNNAGEPKLDNVDYCFSNENKNDLVDFLLSFEKEREVKKNYLKRERVRSFIKIQDGCDEYCTYCLIPYLRGHIKSREEDDIIEEIKKHLMNGAKEIVLTGIHISSYGLDRIEKKDANDNIRHLSYESKGAIEIAREKLLSLVNRVANLKIEVDGNLLEVERIRLGSLEPRIIDETFVKTLLDSNDEISKKFCRNFALSLQSGSDKTLKRMNRHYTKNDFENACNIIRKYMPISTITTDVIVGFPGETEEDFEESLNFVKKMRFYNPNIFPYSVRKGTKAAEFKDQLTKETKHHRAVKMIKECEVISKEIENEISDMKRKVFGNGSDDILVEETIVENGIKYNVGYTKEYIKKKIEAN